MSAQIHATVVRRAFHVRFDKLVRVSVYQAGGGGVVDHGLLLGLGDDDHSQYHTDGRGDARYYRKDAVDTVMAGKADVAHTHTRLHTHANRATLDAIPSHDAAETGQVLRRSDVGLEWGDAGQSAGGGDMLASIYDADGDGIVDAAASVPWDGVVDAPLAFPPAAHSHDGDYDALGAASAAVAAHESRKDNPHAVTAAQVGADPAGEAASQRAAHEAAFDHTMIGTDAGVSDHGELSGLGDDDHPQYHTDARGDARYERIDAAILRTSDLAGPGAAETAARSDHDHDGSYDAAGAASTAVASHQAEASAHVAADIDYDNASSGTAGTTIQAAMDEVAGIAALAYSGRIPAGGGTGDVLTRQSDGVAGWQTPAAHGSGNVTGLAQRPHFERTGARELTLAGGCTYEIDGQIVSTSADVTYTVTGLSTSTAEWQYLYIKTGSAGTLTAADLINSTTAPAWDASRQGWYDGGGNRCIFAFYNTGDGNVFDFTDGGRGLFYFETEQPTNIVGTNVGTAWMAVQLLLPVFSQEASVFLYAYNTGTAKTYYLRRYGSAGSGSYLIRQESGAIETLRMFVQADGQGRAEIQANVSGTNLVSVFQVGYTLPVKGI